MNETEHKTETKTKKIKRQRSKWHQQKDRERESECVCVYGAWCVQCAFTTHSTRANKQQINQWISVVAIAARYIRYFFRALFISLLVFCCCCCCCYRCSPPFPLLIAKNSRSFSSLSSIMAPFFRQRFNAFTNVMLIWMVIPRGFINDMNVLCFFAPSHKQKNTK